MNANDILVPFTYKELAARWRKMRDGFEHEFPGLFEKTRDWMKSEEFWAEAPSVPTHFIIRGQAPTFVKIKMVQLFHGERWLFEDEKQQIMVENMAVYLWKWICNREKLLLI